MSRYLILSSFVALTMAGCASVDDLRKKEPVFFATTAKTPQAYGECVAQTWRDIGKREVTLQKIRNGVDVVARSSMNVEEVVRVQHYDNKTHVEMFVRTNYHTAAMTQGPNVCL